MEHVYTVVDVLSVNYFKQCPVYDSGFLKSHILYTANNSFAI